MFNWIYDAFFGEDEAENVVESEHSHSLLRRSSRISKDDKVPNTSKRRRRPSEDATSNKSKRQRKESESNLISTPSRREKQKNIKAVDFKTPKRKRKASETEDSQGKSKNFKTPKCKKTSKIDDISKTSTPLTTSRRTRRSSKTDDNENAPEKCKTPTTKQSSSEINDSSYSTPRRKSGRINHISCEFLELVDKTPNPGKKCPDGSSWYPKGNTKRRRRMIFPLDRRKPEEPHVDIDPSTGHGNDSFDSSQFCELDLGIKKCDVRLALNQFPTSSLSLENTVSNEINVNVENVGDSSFYSDENMVYQQNIDVIQQWQHMCQCPEFAWYYYYLVQHAYFTSLFNQNERAMFQHYQHLVASPPPIWYDDWHLVEEACDEFLREEGYEVSDDVFQEFVTDQKDLPELTVDEVVQELSLIE